VLRGSYGNFDLDSVWIRYYKSEVKYNRPQEVGKRMRPDGLFTLNTFCKKGAELREETRL